MAKRKEAAPAVTPPPPPADVAPPPADAAPAAPPNPSPQPADLPIESPPIVPEAPAVAMSGDLPKADPLEPAPEPMPGPAIRLSDADMPPLMDTPASQSRMALLAASLAAAAVLGAAAGAITVVMTRAETHPAPVMTVADSTRALEASVAKLNKELASIKSGIDATNRNANAQFGRLTERLDRTEKAQADPAHKLAKIADSLDRLEKRAAPVATQDVDVTGAIAAAKAPLKPPVAQGWHVREFFGGRAVVESRTGELFEIGPGSNLPGLGRVESIKREDGRVVVTAAKGLIVSMNEPRRQPYYMPYRY